MDQRKNIKRKKHKNERKKKESDTFLGEEIRVKKREEEGSIYRQ